MKKIKKWVLILLALALVSGGLSKWMTLKYSNWQSTEGVVTEIRFHDSRIGRRSNDYYEIFFTYRVDGTEYSAVSTYSGEETEQYVGKTVTVWYDPEAPDTASFHKPGPGLWPMVPFILGIPLTTRITNKRGKRYNGKANR